MHVSNGQTRFEALGLVMSLTNAAVLSCFEGLCHHYKVLVHAQFVPFSPLQRRGTEGQRRACAYLEA